MAEEDPSVNELLEDEALAEQEFHISTHHVPGEITLRHSATTDTLDSVMLEPSVIDEDNNTDDDISNENVLDEHDEDKLKIVDGAPETLQEETTPTNTQEKPQATFDFAEEDKTETDTNITEDEIQLQQEQQQQQQQQIVDEENKKLDISSYFSDDKVENQLEDPFGQTFFDTLADSAENTGSPENTEQTLESEIKSEEIEPSHKPEYESQLSHEPESVAFEVVPEGSDLNVMETSLQIIDDKEDFESFTAETASEDIIQEFNNLGISPSNKVLSEKFTFPNVTDGSLSDTSSVTAYDRQFSSSSQIPYDRQLSSSTQQAYDRQLSSTSQSSGGNLAPISHTPPVTSPVHQSFQGTPFSPTQFSPYATPTHHPVAQEKPDNISPSTSPSYQTKEHTDIAPQATVTEDTHIMPTSPSHTANTLQMTFPPVTEDSPSHTASNLSVPFQSLPTGVIEDPFTASLHMSDADRQRDSWIPSDPTRHILVTMATSVPGTFIPTLDQLSTPGLIVDEAQGDPVKDLVHRYMGEQEAINRQILSVDTVTQDIDGLKKLLEGGCYRSSIDMTGRLLTEAGQGQGHVGTLTQHSPQTLQLWFTRLTLLMKLRLYNIAETEYQAFQGLDTPDLYYEFYPHIFPGRKGSMVPFGMRVLHAELPHYLGRSQEALDRLYYVLAIIQKILKNLEDGLCEDGSAVEISPDSRTASKELWSEREIQVLYVIGNTFLAIKDFEAAMSVYDSLLSKDTSSKASLLSGMGRIYLQMGNVLKAKECFKQSEVLSDSSMKTTVCRNYINRGLEAMCTNNFNDAFQEFKTAVEADPTNASAVNNMAVCSLYLGRLKDALKTLEKLVHDDPDKNLHEGILFNLCTLYELESSRALHKKQALLDLVSRHKGDGFPVACLKMS